jgi:hypothetical protein
MSLQFLKQSPLSDVFTREAERRDPDDAFGRIRCPLCDWHPTASSLWCCWHDGAPEPFFHGCGTLWNTFSTRGKCPGCAHQWRWTSCHRCGEWSRHDDWYETEPGSV